MSAQESLVVFYCPTHARHNPNAHIVGGVSTDHPEKPKRNDSFLEAVKKLSNTYNISFQSSSREAKDDELTSVHTKSLVDFVSNAWDSFFQFRGDQSGEIVPEVIPPVWSGKPHKPAVLFLQAGLYCYDTATPIGKETCSEARKSAAIAIDSAVTLINNPRCPVYALCRPPGHHASRDHYGGYCYFNNAALAAEILATIGGKVVIFDIDYHHGNGTQDIFYERDDVFYISIHGNPDFEYPFFSGSESEEGEGKGKHFNRNFPMSAGTSFEEYLISFTVALEIIRKYSPAYIVVSLGFDTADGDPISSFRLKPPDYYIMGTQIRRLGIPLLVVQEGGYSTSETLEAVCEKFFRGILVSKH